MRLPLHPVVAFRTMRALVRLVRHLDLDSVNRLAPSLVTEVVTRPVAERMMQHERGRRAIADRYRLPAAEIPWTALGRLGEGTFGRTLHDNVIGRGLHPEDIYVRPVHSVPEYVDAHLFEVHDFWHIATGFDTSPAGELGLLAFYSAQFPAPFAIFLMAAIHANTALFSLGDHAARMDALTRGWLLGTRSEPLFGVRWHELYDRPVKEVRERIGCPVDEVEHMLASPSGRRPKHLAVA